MGFLILVNLFLPSQKNCKLYLVSVLDPNPFSTDPDLASNLNTDRDPVPDPAFSLPCLKVKIKLFFINTEDLFKNGTLIRTDP